MAHQTIRLALALALAAALTASSVPSMASAKRTRPSGSSGASSGQRASRGSAGVTRSSGSGRASGRATYGYYGRGPAYGQVLHHYPYYWYLGYPGLYYWRWGWPYLFDGWCSYPGACQPSLYQVVRGSSEPGVLETDIKPKKAEVVVDGQLLGEARDYNGNWDLLFLKPGERSVQFRAPGYMTLTLWIVVEPGSYFRIKERLTEGEGSDPRSMERPVASESSEGGAVVVAPAADDALPQGLLRIEASPADAAIYLDGEFLARADELARLHGALPVARGRHVVEVVRPGYQGESIEIVVEPEEPQRVRIDLKRKEEAAGD
jgi:hypothetical protein